MLSGRMWPAGEMAERGELGVVCNASINVSPGSTERDSFFGLRNKHCNEKLSLKSALKFNVMLLFAEWDT